MTDPYHKLILRNTEGLSDVYDVLDAFGIANPATQHAVKKLLAAGKRGHKGLIQDLKEARDSITRAIAIEESHLVAAPVQFNCPPLCSKCHKLHRVGDPCPDKIDRVPRADQAVDNPSLCPGCTRDPKPHRRTDVCI